MSIQSVAIEFIPYNSIFYQEQKLRQICFISNINSCIKIYLNLTADYYVFSASDCNHINNVYEISRLQTDIELLVVIYVQLYIISLKWSVLRSL